MSTRRTTLGACCEIVSGATPSTTEPRFWDGDIEWATPKDLSELEGKHIHRTSRRITPEGLSSCAATLLPPNSVLFSSRAPIGYVAINAVPMATNQGFKSLVPKEGEVDPDFLYHWLRANRSFLESLGNGATFKEVSKAVVSRVEISLPSVPEQRRIAELLDKADAIRRKRKECISLTDELLRSAFLEKFGDPVTNPQGWDVKPLGAVIDRLEAGWSANGDARPRRPEEFGVLKVSAVTSGVFRGDEHKAVPATEIDRDLVTPRAGDLLFSRANTRELVAATCLVERDEPRLFLPDKIWRVVPRNRFATTPYLRYLLAHERFRGELTKTATGTSGSMLNVSMDKLRSMRGPIPPFEAQQDFAAFVWRALRAKSRTEDAENLASDLCGALLDRTYAGGRAC